MYIEKIKIDKFRVLEDIKIRFQPPGGATADHETGNVVNVIAGINGTGKTSLLEAIYEALSVPVNFMYHNKCGIVSVSNLGEINFSTWQILNNEIEKLNKEGKKNSSFYDKSRLIFMPSQQSFQYSPVTQMTVQYSFAQKVNIQQILGNAEFYTKEYVLNKILESNIADPVQRTKKAVDAFNSHFLNANLLTRLSNLSKVLFNRPVFSNAANQEVTIDQLSDGEKQLYGRVIALMILNPSNSMILIDEPEIALHPAWQQKIMKIYSQIGKNNQFIVATHSPQIIASVPYKNRILLRKENGKIEPVHMNQPPSGVDVNSILSEIMGADPRPPELLKLYAQYRKFVEERKENTPEALAVKAQLSEESDHSRFMQEMAFLIELRDVV
jgi:predicted ATP-binding protein involved in virulence